MPFYLKSIIFFILNPWLITKLTIEKKKNLMCNVPCASSHFNILTFKFLFY